MKTNSFRRFCSLILIALLGVSSCDFIDSDVEPPTRVTFPSYQQIYTGGRNTYFINGTFLQGDFVDFTGTLTMTWNNVTINDRLNSIPNAPFVKFTTEETIGVVTNTATQYIIQSEDAGSADRGSVFLHAFDSGDPANIYWIDTDANLENSENIQVLFSPFQPDLITAGEKGQTRRFDFDVMDNCDAAGTPCIQIATVNGSFTVVDEALTPVSTNLGDFEAYRIDYDFTITPATLIEGTGSALTTLIDFRASCAAPNFDQTLITVQGSMWINPDVGPVMIQNSCNGDTYTARLTNTNFLF